MAISINILLDKTEEEEDLSGNIEREKIGRR